MPNDKPQDDLLIKDGAQPQTSDNLNQNPVISTPITTTDPAPISMPSTDDSASAPFPSPQQPVPVTKPLPPVLPTDGDQPETKTDTVVPPNTNTPPPAGNDVVDTVVTSNHVPKKYGGEKIIATIFGILLVAGAVVAGVTMVQNQQLRLGYAWDCSKYNFEVQQDGNVRVLNGSTRNEPGQKADVYIDGNPVNTFDVPALTPGNAADLGRVDVPANGGFSWRVDGTVDCENSGSYTPQNTLTPSPEQTNSPTPIATSIVTPTQHPTQNCQVRLDLPDTAVCWYEAKTNVPVGWTVVSLPSTGGPYYLQTDWYVVKPTLGSHHYEQVGPITVGQKGTIYADWPGVQPGQTDISENHYGLNVVDAQGNVLFDNCSAGMDYYWTPYVCPLPTPTTTTQNTAQCSAVIAYDTDWNELNTQALSQLKAGEVIYLTVTGTTNTGSFDKARFTVNGVLRPETTSLKPGTTSTYYDEYTIPDGTSAFSVGAQIHHVDLDWL